MPGMARDAASNTGPDRDTLLPIDLFRQLVEHAPVALSITDAAANILYANRRYEQLTGYPRSELVGNNQSMLSNKATPRAVYQELWETVTDKRTWSGTLVNRTRGGEGYLAELTISPVLDDSGRISHFLGMHRDITKVHELQQQLAHQKGLLEIILDTAPLVVGLLDAERRVLVDNQEYKKLLGDLRGAEPAEVLMKAVSEQAGIVLPEPGERGRDYHNVEVRLEFNRGGPRWFDCSAIWLDNPDESATSYFKAAAHGTVCLFVASETTLQRREHERARMEHLRASLAEQQRIRGMREALAAATYQIQQPLNLIKAATAMLERNGDAQDHLWKVLDEIRDTAQTAFKTLSAALPAEQEEPLQPLNLNEIMQEVLELSTDLLLKNGIVVSWRPTAVLSVFTGRAKEVRGLLMNILDNAIIALSEARIPSRELEICTSESHGVLTVTVQDNGPGIPREQRLAVFEPLYCGWRNKVGHAGMGLSMAQEIATLHGGGIQIDGDMDEGCRVRIEFPVVR
jgi:nitrogen fixation negative regulator NifL